VHDDFCCVFASSGGSSSSGGGPAGCAMDPSISCTGGADGFACSAGMNPNSMGANFSCSTPAIDASGVYDYCCYQGFPGSSTTCLPDDDLAAVCPDPDSYGYQCQPGVDPTSLLSKLDCKAGQLDVDGVHEDYWCSYQ
jgi:hypothetical protein